MIHESPLPIIYIKDRKNETVTIIKKDCNLYINSDVTGTIQSCETTCIDIEVYRMILFEECSNVHIIVNTKLMKLLCIKCENISVDINVNMIAGIDYDHIKKSVLILRGIVPLLNISLSESIRVIQHSDKTVYVFISCYDCQFILNMPPMYRLYEVPFDSNQKLSAICKEGSKTLTYVPILNDIEHHVIFPPKK